ncbi:MAG TPA: hypothetical protein HA346_06650 [Thermoplasmata archaeon]|nr:hypothetical protein [Thermoplasmata archaeon]
MSIKKAGVILALVVIGALVSSSLTLLLVPEQKVVEEEIPPVQLKEDLDFLIKSIEEIHPNPYAYASEEEFDEMKNG